ncbi:MAG: penicillin acylase family protein [Promethearchaeota archaeon]|nr:MAG: penicillin acylase family protein [Candidatus Lokiarchaeota archaeon]
MEKFLEIAKNAFPKIEGSEELEGLKEKVEILWDKWGIPHIYANSVEDACFCVGYIHSRHRLWQLETIRRLTTGELSELLGDATIERDKYYKTIGLHRIARECEERITQNKDTDIYIYLNSYVNGINSGMEKAKENPPLEFATLNLNIRKWKIEDSLKIALMIDWGLSDWNFPLEILREKLILKLGPELANKLMPLYSKANKGSNGWVVGPEKSKTGSVLFANDPHLPLTLPAIWFLIHIVCPGLNSIGTSFPGLPIVVLGHNEKIAWGCTNVHADTIDLFRLEINPENENQYKYDDQWIDFEIIEEPIHIKDQEDPLPFKVKMSKFGPIIDTFEIDSRIYQIDLPDKLALRWTSYEPHLENTVEAFMKINKASDWNEFRKGTSLLYINPQNVIYGDVEGNIGHQHGGRIPVRKQGDGATITEGRGSKDNWQRISEFEEMYSILNPKMGFVYTANFNEDKSTSGLLIAQDRSEPYRQIRIKHLLQSKEGISFQDMINFQLDYCTLEAAEFLPIMLKYLKSNDNLDDHDEYISLLENWDYILTKDTIAGTIYKIWTHQTMKSIIIPFIGEEVFKPFTGVYSFDLKILFEYFKDKTKEIEELLFKSFQNTITFLSEELSPDHKKWKWGNLHKVTLTHPFSLASEDAKVLNIGPYKIGGDTNTLNNGHYDPLSNFDVIVGPSYRQIHDLTDWDKSLCIIPGGQSGLPFHEHYKDLMKLYVKGKYIPMLFSKSEILKNLEGILKLEPK